MSCSAPTHHARDAHTLARHTPDTGHLAVDDVRPSVRRLQLRYSVDSIPQQRRVSSAHEAVFARRRYSVTTPVVGIWRHVCHSSQYLDYTVVGIFAEQSSFSIHYEIDADQRLLLNSTWVGVFPTPSRMKVREVWISARMRMLGAPEADRRRERRRRRTLRWCH